MTVRGTYSQRGCAVITVGPVAALDCRVSVGRVNVDSVAVDSVVQAPIAHMLTHSRKLGTSLMTIQEEWVIFPSDIFVSQLMPQRAQ